MILHGNARGGARDLARHLLKDENEHIDVHELRGFLSEDLPSALNEAYLVSKATRARKFLYSLSLNPPEDEKVSAGTFLKAITQVEKTLNLKDQPRAIVFHEKKGRRHCHVVWSRIDAARMKAIPISNDWPKLAAVSRSLFNEHGWKMPPGMIDRKNRDPKNFTMAQWQQAKRIGKDPRKIKQDLQESWALSFDRPSFEQALEERGYALAKGDRAGFVVLDHRYEIFALGTKWMSVKVKDIRARLGNERNLDTPEQARIKIAKRMTARLSSLKDHQTSRIAQRRAELEERRQGLVAKQKAERRALRQTQKDRWQAEVKARQARFNRGLRGLMDRFTGQHARIRKRNEQEMLAAALRDQREADAMIFTHIEQRRTLQGRIKRLEGYNLTRSDALDRDIGQYQDIGRRKRDVFEISKDRAAIDRS